MAELSTELERISQITDRSKLFQELNSFLSTITVADQKFENFYQSLNGHNNIHRFLILKLIKKFQLFTHAVEILKKTTNLVLRSGVLNLDFLYQHPSSLVKWTYFDAEIIPHVSYLVRLKLLHRLAKFSLSSQNAEIFFEEYSKKYGIPDVCCFLPYCSSEFIISTIKKFGLKLDPFELDIISKKASLAPVLFDVIYAQIQDKHSIHSSNRISLSWAMIKRSIPHGKLNIFYEVLDKIRHSNKYDSTNLFGFKTIKKLIQRDRLLFIGKAKIVSEYTRAKLVKSFLSREELVDFMENYCGTKSPSEIFNRWDQFCGELLQILSLKEKEKLVVMLYQEKLKRNLYNLDDLVSMYGTEVNVDVLAVLPSYIREGYVEKTLKSDDRAAEKIQLLPVEKSVPRLREMMVMSSQVAVRCSLIRPLIRTCLINSDFDELFQVLAWLFDRYRNDSMSLRSQIFEIVSEKFDEITISEEMHRLLVDQIRIAIVKDELDRFPTGKILPQLISWSFDHNLDAHELMNFYVDHTSYYVFDQKKHSSKFKNLLLEVLRGKIDSETKTLDIYGWIDIFNNFKSKHQRVSLRADLVIWIEQMVIKCYEKIDTYEDYERDQFLGFYYDHNCPWTRGLKLDFSVIFDQIPLQLPTVKRNHQHNLFSKKYDLTSRGQIASKLAKAYQTHTEKRSEIIKLSYYIFNKIDPNVLNFTFEPPTNPKIFLQSIFDQIFLDAISKVEIDLIQFSHTVHTQFFLNSSLEKFAVKMPQSEILTWINSNFDQNPTFSNQFLRLLLKLGSWNAFLSKLSEFNDNTSFNQKFVHTLFQAVHRDHRHEAFGLILANLDSIETLNPEHLTFLINQLQKTPSEFQFDLHSKIWFLTEKFSQIDQIPAKTIELFNSSVKNHHITLPIVKKTINQVLYTSTTIQPGHPEEIHNQQFSDLIFSNLPSIILQLGVTPLNQILSLYKNRIMANLDPTLEKQNKALVQKTRELLELLQKLHGNKTLIQENGQKIEEILSQNLSEIEFGLKQMNVFDLIIDYRVAIWTLRFDSSDPDGVLHEIFCYLNDFCMEFGPDLTLLVAMEPLKNLLKARFTRLNRTKTYNFFLDIFLDCSKLEIWQIFTAGFLECFSDSPREYRELREKILKIGKDRVCVRVSGTLADLRPIDVTIEKLVREKQWDILDRLWPDLFSLIDQVVRRKIVKIFAKNDLEPRMSDETFWINLERFVEETEFSIGPDGGNLETDQIFCFYKIIDFYVKNKRDVPRSNIDFLIREFLKFSFCVWNLYKEDSDLERMFLGRFLDQILDLHPISSKFWMNDATFVFSLIDAIADFHERNPALRIPDHDWLVELFIHHGFQADKTNFLIHDLELFFNETLIPKQRFEEVRKFLLIHDPTRVAIEYFVRENPEFLSENIQAILNYLLRTDHLPNNNDCKAITEFLIDLSQKSSNSLIKKFQDSCLMIFQDSNQITKWKILAELYIKVSSKEDIEYLSLNPQINWDELQKFFC